MIAADTSAWIDYSKGNETRAALFMQEALEGGALVLPPLVLVELLSSPKITSSVESLVQALPRIDLSPGYWERTALMRRAVMKKGRKARLGDALIAQSCIDQDVALVTGDSDFRHFTPFGLRLVA